MLENAVFLDQISKKYRKDLDDVSSIFARQKEASQQVGGKLVDLQEQTERSKRYGKAMQDIPHASEHGTAPQEPSQDDDAVKTTMLSQSSEKRNPSKAFIQKASTEAPQPSEH